ncbi:MAG: alpha/beta hydrolase [Candidatus Lokiarchaeota archaeon]|nr:alpha/beta hydrolase [Candidatus Lokiarchaeota archaeon]
MDAVPWLVVAALVALLVAVADRYFRKKYMYFARIDTSGLIIEPALVPAGDISLNAIVVRPRAVHDGEGGHSGEQLPLVIVEHSWGTSVDSAYIRQYATSIVLGLPCVVLACDLRGHGKSPGDRTDYKRVRDDLKAIVGFGLTLPGIDQNRVGFMGFSTGGSLALTEPYLDARVKAIVAVAAAFNPITNFMRRPRSITGWLFKVLFTATDARRRAAPGEDLASLSPQHAIVPGDAARNRRVFLIHARDDRVVLVDQFEALKEVLGLGPGNYLLLEKGGHAFFGQEMLVLGAALRFFAGFL